MPITNKSLLKLLLLTTGLVLPQAVWANTWQLTVGSQSPDCQFVEGLPAATNCQSRQAMAFEPNEIWVHAGDNITWTHRTNEGHTVTFLQPNQVRPSAAVGCTSVTGFAAAPNDSDYDPAGSVSNQCVNSGVLGPNGATYTIRFPTAGNYKFTCLIHAAMYGTVHVLASGAGLPHDQAFYDRQQKVEAKEIYASDLPLSNQDLLGPNEVATSGMVVSSGGGWGYEAVMRFLQTVIRIHVGDTVEWINFDPVEPHTVTFGCPTDDLSCANHSGPTAFFNSTGPAVVAPDGVRAAEITTPFNPATSQITSGFLVATRQDAGGQPQAPLATNKFRLKFNTPGNYRYICQLHDELGMIGWVIVSPKGEGEGDE